MKITDSVSKNIDFHGLNSTQAIEHFIDVVNELDMEMKQKNMEEITFSFSGGDEYEGGYLEANSSRNATAAELEAKRLADIRSAEWQREQDGIKKAKTQKLFQEHAVPTLDRYLVKMQNKVDAALGQYEKLNNLISLNPTDKFLQKVNKAKTEFEKMQTVQQEVQNLRDELFQSTEYSEFFYKAYGSLEVWKILGINNPYHVQPTVAGKPGIVIGPITRSNF